MRLVSKSVSVEDQDFRFRTLNFMKVHIRFIVGSWGSCDFRVHAPKREPQSRTFVSWIGPDDVEIRGKMNFSHATWPNNDHWRERCRNDAQQWTTVQRAPRRDAGAYRGSCPRHGYVPSMKESKRNNCISGPGGHCSTAAHARPYLAVLTRLPLRAEAALKPMVPRARKNLVFAIAFMRCIRVLFMPKKTLRPLSTRRFY